VRRDGVGRVELDDFTPFPRPPHGRICVKVINHFGDEVQKVFVV
jgi:hypothetical protein